MSIASLQKAAGIVSAQAPDAQQEVAMGRVVGVALAMAADISSFASLDMGTVTKTELINHINGMDNVYRMISAVNEEILICTDTAVRCFTKALICRVQMAKGVAAAFAGLDLFDSVTSTAAEVLIPEFKVALA
jgi:hypothetical protein